MKYSSFHLQQDVEKFTDIEKLYLYLKLPSGPGNGNDKRYCLFSFWHPCVVQNPHCLLVWVWSFTHVTHWPNNLTKLFSFILCYVKKNCTKCTKCTILMRIWMTFVLFALIHLSMLSLLYYLFSHSIHTFIQVRVRLGEDQSDPILFCSINRWGLSTHFRTLLDSWCRKRVTGRYMLYQWFCVFRLFPHIYS